MNSRRQSQKQTGSVQAGQVADRGDAELSPRTTAVLSAGILGLALAARIYGIGQAPLWHDEAYTFLAAAASPAEIVDLLKRDSAPPLYYFLLHVWIALFGESEPALRLLSTLISVALVGGIYWAGRRLYSTEIGLMAALLAAVSPVQIHYSQQLRMYTLLPLLSLASIYFLVRYLQTSESKYALLCALATLLALYTHPFSLFLPPAHLALILLAERSRRKWKELALLYASVLAGYLPWAPILLLQIGNEDPIAWFAAYWRRWGPLEAVAWTLSSFSPGGAQPPIVDGFVVPALGRVWPAAFGGVLALTGAVRLVSTRWAGDRSAATFLPVYLCVPLACSVLTSVAISPNYLAGRVDQTVFPAFCLLVAAGIAAIPWRSLRWAALGAAIVMSALTLNQYYRQDYGGSDRDIAAFIAARVRPGEPIVSTSFTRTSLTYYLRRHGIQTTMISYPRDTARHLGYQNDGKLLENPAFLEAEAQAVVEELRAAVGPNGRFFVLLGYPLRVNKPLWDRLTQTADLKMVKRPYSYLGRQWVFSYDVMVLEFQFVR